MEVEPSERRHAKAVPSEIAWPRFVFFNTLAWIGLAALTVATSARAMEDGISLTLYMELLPRFVGGYLPYMLVTPLLYRAIYRRLAQQSGRKVLIRGLVFDLVLFLVVFVPAVAIFWGYRPGESAELFYRHLAQINAYYWLVDGITFSAAYGIYYALAFARISRRRSEQTAGLKQANQELALALKSSQLQLLRSQFEPHFLFNALNSISALVRLEEKDEAQQAIQQISDLLRYSLQHTESDLVPLTSELEFARDYMGLQRLRHRDKINFELNHNLARNDHQVPPCLLQPVLENSVKHGLEAGADHVDIDLRLEEDEQDLVISVRNTVPSGTVETLPHSLSIGLDALKRRLVTRFGQAARLDTCASGESFLLTMRIPQGQT